MSKRKLVLIIANIFLLVVVITQGLLLSRDGSKNFRLKETPDQVVITSGGESIELAWDGDAWVVGEKKYPTNDYTVDSLLDSLENIRCLEKVSSTGKQGAIEKYDLTDDKKITVTAWKNGQELRSIEIGKTASTVSQNFVTVDGGKDIYLATGGLRNIFSVDEGNVRSDIVWEFDASEINNVTIERNATTGGSTPTNVNTPKAPFSVSKSGSGEDLQWTVSGSDIDLDSGKAQSWFDSLGTLTTGMWYDESKDLGGEKIATVKITYGTNIATIDIFELPPVGEETIPSYYGKSSTTPYPFQLTSYTMEKINKNPEELAK